MKHYRAQVSAIAASSRDLADRLANADARDARVKREMKALQDDNDALKNLVSKLQLELVKALESVLMARQERITREDT